MQASRVDGGGWSIVASKGMSAFSYGEFVRVMVAPASNPKSSIVHVLTRRRLATNVTAKGDYSEAIFAGIDLRLQ